MNLKEILKIFWKDTGISFRKDKGNFEKNLYECKDLKKFQKNLLEIDAG